MFTLLNKKHTSSSSIMGTYASQLNAQAHSERQTKSQIHIKCGSEYPMAIFKSVLSLVLCTHFFYLLCAWPHVRSLSNCLHIIWTRWSTKNKPSGSKCVLFNFFFYFKHQKNHSTSNYHEQEHAKTNDQLPKKKLKKDQRAKEIS